MSLPPKRTQEHYYLLILKRVHPLKLSSDRDPSPDVHLQTSRRTPSYLNKNLSKTPRSSLKLRKSKLERQDLPVEMLRPRKGSSPGALTARYSPQVSLGRRDNPRNSILSRIISSPKYLSWVNTNYPRKEGRWSQGS